MSSRNRSRVVSMPCLPALMLGTMLVCGSALADIEVSNMSASSYDNVAVTHLEPGGRYTLRSSGFDVDDLKKMQATLDGLQRSKDEQARQLADLKRNTSSSVSSGELSDLKRTVKDQQGEIGNLRKQVEELKRSSGSSSSSSELSSLKRTVSDQDRELQNLKRSLDDLSRKVK
ncbi:hypothetical protein NPS46_19415 [Pseudomonas putida]|uniref:hypothetical protein n=1 Tax=Pseudomonas putida TaxID=303 RepID=UPI0023635C96|nr:hypothetical protein [Pseudomonas putida]MDD2054723.1 hypothetical protein [Pseudomonas putida]